MAQCELFSPIAYPMLIEPNDWTNDRHGGYLLNEIRMCHDLVRRGNMLIYTGRNTASCSEQDSEDRRTPSILYVTMVAKMVCWRKVERLVSLSLFKSIQLPVKPFDIDTNKGARQSYKRECAEVYNKRGRCISSVM